MMSSSLETTSLLSSFDFDDCCYSHEMDESAISTTMNSSFDYDEDASNSSCSSLARESRSRRSSSLSIQPARHSNTDRRLVKQNTEKRRRGRINSSLGSLKSVLLECMQQNPDSYVKLEKADLLDMAVKFLKRQKPLGKIDENARAVRAFENGKTVSTSAMRTNYVKGFADCAQTTLRYLDQRGADPLLFRGLANHLSAITQQALLQPARQLHQRISDCSSSQSVACRSAPPAVLPRPMATRPLHVTTANQPISEVGPLVTSLSDYLAPCVPGIWRPYQ